MNENVFFIGFMGTGKSTIGKAVAERLYLDFVDTDDLIERQSNMPINEIFKLRGEDYFRRLENAVIKDLASGYNTVVATGGGVPLYYDNMKAMGNSGLIVTLEASSTVLWDRLKGCDNRPLLKKYSTFEQFNALYSERKIVYDKADIVIKTDGKSVEQVVNECLKEILD